MPTQAKREAQEALFTAIREQAENNMHAAMRPSERPNCSDRWPRLTG